jgi:hypothetical protein
MTAPDQRRCPGLRIIPIFHKAVGVSIGKGCSLAFAGTIAGVGQMHRRLQYVLLGLILIYAALVRLYVINVPFHTTAEGIGSWYGIMARNYLRIPWSEHHGVPVQSVGHWPGTPLRFYSHHPPLMPLTIAVSYKIFGQGDWQTRLPAALCTLGNILLLYFLLKEYDSPAALYASAIFASLPITLYYGGQPEFLNPQFVFLTLLTTVTFFNFNKEPKLKTLLFLSGAFALAAATDWPAFYLVPLATIYFLVNHRRQHWPLILVFVLFSLLIFFALYAQIVLTATGDWAWMLDHIRTRTIGVTPSQKISFLTWLHQAWTYNREHHTIPVLILSATWFIIAIANRKSKIENRPIIFLLLFAAVHLVIARQGSYSHSWWWWPLTPFLALSSGLCIAHLVSLVTARARISFHMIAILFVVLFSAMNLRTTLPHLLDPNFTSAGQPYDGPTLARAVRFASPNSNTPVIIVSGDVHPSLWYYANRPIKMHVWSIDALNERLKDTTADLPFAFSQQCPARPAAVIVPKLYANAAKDLLNHLSAHYRPLNAPPDLAELYEMFSTDHSTGQSPPRSSSSPPP